jgi:hypothetical protein
MITIRLSLLKPFISPNLRWPYQAMVIKILDSMRSPMVIKERDIVNILMREIMKDGQGVARRDWGGVGLQCV